MKVRVPKSFMALPQSERDKINEAMSEEVERLVDANFCKLQRTWIKFACIVLNKGFGFGKRRLMSFLGNWRTIYRYNASLSGDAEQAAWLEQEMARLFGKDGYPEGFMDRLEKIGEERR